MRHWSVAPGPLVTMFTFTLTCLAPLLLLSLPSVSQVVRYPVNTWNNRFQEVWGAELTGNNNNVQKRFQQPLNNYQNSYQSAGNPNDINLEDILRQQLAQEGVKVDTLETVNAGNVGSSGLVGNNGGAAGGFKNPYFQFLNPAGVRITVPGPYDESDQYRLSYHVNVNRDLGNSRTGQYNGEVVILRGSSWTFTVPDVRVNYRDTIYYLVEVRGQQGLRTWKREHRGYYQVPNGMVFSVDNKEVGRITPGESGLSPSLNGKSKMAPFDQEFYLVYGIHVGGDTDFPDTLEGKPWTNGDPKNKLNFWQNRTTWHPTWNKNAELNIYDIRLTSLSY